MAHVLALHVTAYVPASGSAHVLVSMSILASAHVLTSVLPACSPVAHMLLPVPSAHHLVSAQVLASGSAHVLISPQPTCPPELLCSARSPALILTAHVTPLLAQSTQLSDLATVLGIREVAQTPDTGCSVFLGSRLSTQFRQSSVWLAASDETPRNASKWDSVQLCIRWVEGFDFFSPPAPSRSNFQL